MLLTILYHTYNTNNTNTYTYNTKYLVCLHSLVNVHKRQSTTLTTETLQLEAKKKEA